MSIPDATMQKYFIYTSGMTAEQYQPLIELSKKEPRETKAKLAERIVLIYHGPEKAKQAREEFDRVHRDKGLPDQVANITFPKNQVDLVSLLAEAGLVSSKSEARRLIEQGGVKIDQKKMDDPNYKVSLSKTPLLVQCGKRKFARISASNR